MLGLQRAILMQRKIMRLQCHHDYEMRTPHSGVYTLDRELNILLWDRKSSLSRGCSLSVCRIGQ